MHLRKFTLTLVLLITSCQKGMVTHTENEVNRILNNVDSHPSQKYVDTDPWREAVPTASSCGVTIPPPVTSIMNKIFRLQAKRKDARCEESPWKADKVCGIRWQHGCYCGAEPKPGRSLADRGEPIDSVDECCREHDECLEITPENKDRCDRLLCKCVIQARRDGECNHTGCKLAYAGIKTVFCINWSK